MKQTISFYKILFIFGVALAAVFFGISTALLFSGTSSIPLLNIPEDIKKPSPSMLYTNQVAWLTVLGTEIDNAVMQAEDNDYYLRRDETGTDDIWGCYYMDYECGINSRNLIVYGHSLEDNPDAARFSQLKRFLEEDFAQQNKSIRLYYDGAWREYEVISAGYANVETDTIAISANPDTSTLDNITAAALARSVVDFGVTPSTGAELLTLCTCTADSGTRFIVTAVRR